MCLLFEVWFVRVYIRCKIAKTKFFQEKWLLNGVLRNIIRRTQVVQIDHMYFQAYREYEYLSWLIFSDAEVVREESLYNKRHTRGYKCVFDSHSFKICYDMQNEIQH